VNTGTTIQVNSQGKLLIGNKEYKLLQYHFHTPSEEAINGVNFPINVHLVHQDVAGKLAVVGVNFAEGSPNSFVASLWKYLPAKKGEKVAKAVPCTTSMEKMGSRILTCGVFIPNIHIACFRQEEWTKLT
jgi:carbonic anhydrase